MAAKREKESGRGGAPVPALIGQPRGVAPTIRMERSAEDADGGPLTADVHPDEVANFEKAGWKKV